MASSEGFRDYIIEQLYACGTRYSFSTRKMFGEYCIYVRDSDLSALKPMFFICDDTLYIKKHDVLANILADNECGYPYEGAKENYILDIDNLEKLSSVIELVASILPNPKPKKPRK